MTVIGIIGVLLLALLALGLAAITAWSGWRAAGELGRGFRSRPPGAVGVALSIAGVALPLLLIVVFTVLLAVVLLRMI